jgi:zinc transport system permease protein
MKTGNYRFIFYSALTLILFGMGFFLEPQASRDFLRSFELWRDPILAGVLCGLGAALLGVYILLNRIVFVSLALSQGAGLGIFLIFWVGGMLGLVLDQSMLPFVAGLTMAVLFAVLFSWLRHNQSFSEESLIGLLYVLGAGLILIIGDRVTEGHHDLENLLFGNAVAVLPEDLLLVTGVMGVVIAAHFIFQKRFLYISADPTFMKTKGFNTRSWMLLLYLLISLGITASLKTLGALPVFALMLIPPFIALRLARSPQGAFALSALIGVVLPPLAYFYSYLFDLPTGACLVLVSVFYLGANLFEKYLLPRRS